MTNNTGIKYGGRQKGTANKATAKLREAFTELLEDDMGRLEEPSELTLKLPNSLT